MDQRESTDSELLRKLAGKDAEAAFAEIYHRHAPMVRSACRRILGDELTMIDDVSQSVFLILQRKYSKFSKGVVLAGWLYRTAIFAAKTQKKLMVRRRIHERRAGDMEETTTENETPVEWTEIRPLLDQSIAVLSQSQADVVTLRFLENLSPDKIAIELNCSEDAVRKRVERALEKMRGFLKKKNVVTSTGALSALLLAFSLEAEAGAIPSVLQSNSLNDAQNLTPQLIAKKVMIAMTIKQLTTNVGIGLAALLALLMGTGVLMSQQNPSIPKSQPEENKKQANKLKSNKVQVEKNETVSANSTPIKKKPLKKLYRDYEHYQKVSNSMRKASPEKLYELLVKYGMQISEEDYWRLIEEIKQENPLKASIPFNELYRKLCEKEFYIMTEYLRHIPIHQNGWGSGHQLIRKWLKIDFAGVKEFYTNHEFNPFDDSMIKDMLNIYSSPESTMQNILETSDSTSLRLTKLGILFSIWLENDPRSAMSWLEKTPPFKEKRRLCFQVYRYLAANSPREASEYLSYLERLMTPDDKGEKRMVENFRFQALLKTSHSKAFQYVLEKIPQKERWIYYNRLGEISKENSEEFIRVVYEHLDKLSPNDNRMLLPVIGNYFLKNDKNRLFEMIDRINPASYFSLINHFLQDYARKHPDKVYKLAEEFDEHYSNRDKWIALSHRYLKYNKKIDPHQVLLDAEAEIPPAVLERLAKLENRNTDEKEWLQLFFPNLDLNDKKVVKANMEKLKAAHSNFRRFGAAIENLIKSDPKAAVSYLRDRKLMGWEDISGALVNSLLSEGEEPALDYIKSLPLGKSRNGAVEAFARHIMETDDLGKAISFIKREVPRESQLRSVKRLIRPCSKRSKQTQKT